MTASSTDSITVGQALPEMPTAVADPARMKTLSALMRDPNPIHFDEVAVAAVGLGDRTINQGPSNVAYAVSALGAWAGGVTNVVSYRFRYLANVAAGDRLRTGGTITAIDDTPSVRIAECDVYLEVVGGARVLQGTATVRLG
ncbi:protein dehydratase [Gordonia sp. HNM0687]|uniref:Protein dehydratase n=1 Tax=Gordonia mangrovi TaxID=2665643 RepID=A0A6L7GX90_9ACTN|nr:MaoC/PaaZ C-terminal domain-containing protein [Gordonia mangrovi]MXP24243.1 protein dehydratase [Gordonia mangrovi]UVF79936.1 MaoC/PaaZ C-terminal domain-containing protein [Gordonia mangrovi]